MKTQLLRLIANRVFYFDGVTRKFLFCVLRCGVGIFAVKRVWIVNLTDTCAHTLHFLPQNRRRTMPIGFVFIREVFFVTQRPWAMSPPPQKTPGSAEFSVWRGERNLDFVKKNIPRFSGFFFLAMWLDSSPNKRMQRASRESSVVKGRRS